MSEMLRELEAMYTSVWRNNDLETPLSRLPDDFEWVGPGFPGAEVARGPRGTIDFFRDWIDQWDDLHVEWELNQISPGAVLAIVDMRGRGRVSGVPVELSFAQVWSYEDGRPRSMVVHLDADEARHEAGV